MATLVLAVVGRAVGGNIGQAVGAAIGQRIDQSLFGPNRREGPRLGDLSVQSSTYGVQIPKLYGANRVAGTVIWATDLHEDKKKVSNGKGQPKTTAYSYSASFAVALSARPILRVGRIWADGKLLRGVAGDFKTQTGFRLHLGGEAQAIDPLIAATEGVGNTPAYRGLAYAVFETMQLADYGDRIPSLSFEVIADEGDVSVGAILADLGGRAILADVPAALNGFAAYGDTVRGVAEMLNVAIPFSAQDDGAVLRLFAAGTSTPTLAANDLGASAETKRVARLAVERRSASTIPETLTLAHYELARDYQQGVQRARRDGGARRELRLDLPVVIDATRAKALAETRLTRAWAERVEARVHLPWRRLDLLPGQLVRVEGNAVEWRIADLTLERMALSARLVRWAQPSAIAPLAEAGRNLAQADMVQGATIFHLIDLPPRDDALATAPRLVVAATGTSPGWRRAALLSSVDGGASWQEAGTTALPAVIGTAQGALGLGSSFLEDRINSVTITLLHSGLVLTDADEAGIRGGRNVAMLGNELIQFRSALPLGGNLWRLSGLNRGMRGTEWAIAGHSAGDRFILIESDTLAEIAVPAGVAEVRVIAAGLGDGATPPQQSVMQPGQALQPPSPVRLVANRFSNGDTQINWVRRSRIGWRWLDGTDAPLGEESEGYRLTLTPNAGAARIVTSAAATYLYTAAMRAADVAEGAASLTFTAQQSGQFGQSRAASVSFSLS